MKRREFMKVLTAGAAPGVDAKPEDPALRIAGAEVQQFEVPIQHAVKTAFGAMT